MKLQKFILIFFGVWAGFCCLAQWSDEAWTAHRGLTTEAVTNLQAFQVTDTWTRVCDTNIPETVIPFYFPHRYNWIKFHDGSLPATNTTSNTIQKVYYLDIRRMDYEWVGNIANETWITNDILPDSWTDGTVIGEFENETNIVFEIVDDGVTNEYTNTLTFTRTHKIYDGITNKVELDMNYDTRRQLDLYFAIDERECPKEDYYHEDFYLNDFSDYPFYRGRYANIESAKGVLKLNLPNYYGDSGSESYVMPMYVIPMEDYSSWFENTRTYDAITHQDWYDWRDTDNDEDEDTWVATRPEHFPIWTKATFCLSNGLPIQLVTNTVSNTYWEVEGGETNLMTNSVLGWKVGEMNKEYETNAVTWEVIIWTNSYFDYTPRRNLYGFTNDVYEPYTVTNKWTLEWNALLDQYARWYGDTNSWELDDSILSNEKDYTLYLCASTNTNAVVDSLWVKVEEDWEDDNEESHTNTLYEDTWTNDTTNVVSVVLTNKGIAKGYSGEDYDIQNLPEALNSLIWREEHDGWHFHDYADVQIKTFDEITTSTDRDWDYDEEIWDPTWYHEDYPVGWNPTINTAKIELVESSTNSYGTKGVYSFGANAYFSNYDGGSSDEQRRRWVVEGNTARFKYYLKNRMRIPADAEIWMAGRTPVDGELTDLTIGAHYIPVSVTNTTMIYDDYELGITTNYTVYSNFTDMSSLQNITSDWVETSSGLTDIPTWVADPGSPHSDVPYDYDLAEGFMFTANTWRGIIFKDPIILMKYDITNGFEYVE